MKIEILGAILNDGIVADVYDWLNEPCTTPSKIKNAINNSNEELEIYVNSYGGSVFAGFEIYNILSEHKGNITFKIFGLAASAASLIVMAKGAKVLMSPISQMMIHRVYTSNVEGNKNDFDHMATTLNISDETIANAYHLKSNQTVEKILDLMDKETTLSPKQALELKLIDGIEDFNSNKTFLNSMVPRLVNCLNPNSLLSQIGNCKTKQETKEIITNQLNKFFGDDTTKPTNIDNLGGTNMDLKELKDKYPNLVDELLNEQKQSLTNETIKNERERIKALNALAGKGPQNLIDEGIEQGLTAEQVALKILQNQTVTNQKNFDNRVADANDSGINEVVPQNTQQNQQNEIDLLAKMGQEIMNGGK